MRLTHEPFLIRYAAIRHFSISRHWQIANSGTMLKLVKFARMIDTGTIVSQLNPQSKRKVEKTLPPERRVK